MIKTNSSKIYTKKPCEAKQRDSLGSSPQLTHNAQRQTKYD